MNSCNNQPSSLFSHPLLFYSSCLCQSCGNTSARPSSGIPQTQKWGSPLLRTRFPHSNLEWFIQLHFVFPVPFRHRAVCDMKGESDFVCNLNELCFTPVWPSRLPGGQVSSDYEQGSVWEPFCKTRLHMHWSYQGVVCCVQLQASNSLKKNSPTALAEKGVTTESLHQERDRTHLLSVTFSLWHFHLDAAQYGIEFSKILSVLMRTYHPAPFSSGYYY